MLEQVVTCLYMLLSISPETLSLCSETLLNIFAVHVTTLSAAAASSTLLITHCVILQYIHITCYWKTTNHHLNNSSYRLQINK